LAAGRTPARPFSPGTGAAGAGAETGAGADDEVGTGAGVVSAAGAGASDGFGGAVDAARAVGFRCRRFVVPSLTPYPTSTACRSTFGAGLPWIPGSKAACSGDWAWKWRP
jgi:hypothetical protein